MLAIAFINPVAPGYTGIWNQAAGSSRLHFEYFDNGSLAATFDGYAVDANCFEGVTAFSPPSAYVAPYRVCLQP